MTTVRSFLRRQRQLAGWWTLWGLLFVVLTVTAGVVAAVIWGFTLGLLWLVVEAVDAAKRDRERFRDADELAKRRRINEAQAQSATRRKLAHIERGDLSA